MIIEGNWMVLEVTDPVPSGILNLQQRVNLCLRCGMRIWTEDMHIHEAWHDQMGV